MNDQQKKMIEKFQCHGCAADCDISCVDFEEGVAACFYCKRHCARTYVGAPIKSRRVHLGMPRGFCRVGAICDKADGQTLIRL